MLDGLKALPNGFLLIMLKREELVGIGFWVVFNFFHKWDVGCGKNRQ